jgi:osmoprotectant transport system substrate-binding protein
MRASDARNKGIDRISALALRVQAGDVHRLASTVEFVTRDDGLKPLEQAYGFQFGDGNVVPMDTASIYAVLRRPSPFDVGVVFATDGRISAFDLTVLRDDSHFFPSYILAPVIRRATLERLPQIREPLEKLAARIDNDTMTVLNAAVDLQGRRVEDVASEFLLSQGLLSRP